jgi:hypothetical protein
MSRRAAISGTASSIERAVSMFFLASCTRARQSIPWNIES